MTNRNAIARHWALEMENQRKLTPVIEYVAESTTACLVTMVQGNLLAVTLSHLAIASQTGIVAGTLAAATLFFARAENRWLTAVVLGLITALVDFFIHPAMFGAVAVEAITTGVAAGVLSYVIGSLVAYFRKDAVTQD